MKNHQTKFGRNLAFLLSVVMALSIVLVSPMETQAASKKYVKSLSVASKTSVKVGKTASVKATVKLNTKIAQKNALFKVSAKSSNTSVAAVKVGNPSGSKKAKSAVSTIKITGKSAGTATITVTTKKKNNKNKTISKKIKVTVTGSSESGSGSTGSTTGGSTTGGSTTGGSTTGGSTTGGSTTGGSTTGGSTTGGSTTGGSTTGGSTTGGSTGSDTGSTTGGSTGSDTGSTTGGGTGDDTGNTTDQEGTLNKVEWTTTEEPYEGTFSQVNEETGETENYPIQLLRKYVSFNPWPTTNEQVQYVIKHCDDPYVISALYVVALDNYEYVARGNYTGVTYDMIESLMNGAGAVTGSSYVLNSYDKQHINEFGTKTCPVEGSDPVLVSSFASRTFLKGATPYNGYTPEGGLEDKTKWQIIIDQYPYCFDQENEVKKYITLCPRRYTENQDTENGPLVPVEHSQVCRIGFRWNGGKKVWLPTDYAKINTDPGNSALVPYNIKASILFSNDYKAPQIDQGW